ncbi:MAG: hypothetical protein K9K38_15100 [Rhodoferax sp.]|nr:hypothetical protein [Rhodoferax sp.]
MVIREYDKAATRIAGHSTPTNPEILVKLKSGLVSVRKVLSQPWVWFVDIAHDATLFAAWRGTLAEAPADALPQPGVMLWPHLESVEVRGRLFGKPSAKFTLARKSAALVRKALATARATQEKIATVTGLVREFDKDDFSFTLRHALAGLGVWHVVTLAPERLSALLFPCNRYILAVY